MTLLKKTISAVFPKGGEWKSTLIQTVSTSKIFSKYQIGILEADSQNSISDWLKERKESKKEDLPIKLFKYDPKLPLKDAIERYKEYADYLFIDLPGESEAAELTRAALAYSDICVTPIRPSDKAIRAFENNFYPMLEMMVDLRGKEHFYLLPTFAHASTNVENHREIFEPYDKLINILNSIHRDRQIFTYFSQEGQTLEEYKNSINGNEKESKIVNKAILEVEEIAKEILNIISK